VSSNFPIFCVFSAFTVFVLVWYISHSAVGASRIPTHNQFSFWTIKTFVWFWNIHICMCGPRPVSFVACAKFLEFLTTFPRTHTRMVHIYIHNLSPERHGVRVRWRSEKKRARAEALVVCVCEYARIRNTPQKVVVSAKCAFFGLSRLFCSLLSRFKTCRTCFLSFFAKT